jgi:hypothetical protein
LNREKEELVPIGVAEGDIHESLIIAAFDDADIHYAVQKFHEGSRYGFYESVKGHSLFMVLEEDVDKAVEIAKSVTNPQNAAME